MIRERKIGMDRIFVLAGALLITVYCAVVYGLVLLFQEGFDGSPGNYSALVLAGFLGLVAEGVSRPEEMRSFSGKGAARHIRSISQRQWLWFTVCVSLFMVITRDEHVSRIYVILITFSVIPISYSLNRWGYDGFVNLLVRRSPHWRLRAALVGPAQWLKEVGSQMSGVESVVEEVGVFQVDAWSSLEEIEHWLGERDLDVLVIPPRLLPDEWVIRLIGLAERKGFRCWLPLELSRRYGWRFNLQRLGDLDVLTPPTIPLSNTFNRMLKRGFDILVSLMVIPLVLAPLMILVRLIHWRFSPGPLFFRQERLGENGKIFEVIKFRTMHLANDDEARQASKGDPRIFKGGSLLRKLSLDEFPQFLNVLYGEMSVVGPRPHLEAHERQFEKFHERYGMRRFVKPGVTGLAQIRGYRGEILNPGDVRGRARYDIVYLSRWCIWLDLRIVFMTAWQVVFPHRNAY